MKILQIAPTIFPVPLTGYGGTEQIVYLLAKELHNRGHIVGVVAPGGSILPAGVELMPITQGESEESAFQKYRGRLREWDVIHDHTYQSWVYQDSVGVDPPLPIIKTLHTSPTIWGKPPPVFHPCLVGISKSHARDMTLRWGVTAKTQYNGIDLDFYSPDPNIKRNGRLLFLGRYTAEKGPLQAMQIAKRLKMPLDCYGNTTLVSNPLYVDMCRKEADEVLVRFGEGVSRDRTVGLYRSYRALLYPLVWEEPFGLCVVEAQACGMPVVTLNRGSMAEVVNNKISGYVCDTEAELVSQLQNGISKIDSVQPREWASRFSIAAMVDGYLNLYQQILQGDAW